MARFMRIVLLATVAAIPAFCQTSVLVDCSGSVRAYFDNHLFPTLASEILAAADSVDSRPAQLFAFDVQVRPVPSVQSLAYTHQDTHLDGALRAAIDSHAEIVWMITDNIQDDPRDPVAFNTRAFYDILRGDNVARVTVFPLAQQGGQLGVAIYAILLAPRAESLYERQMETLVDRFKGRFHTEMLAMKPLDERTVDAPPVPDNAKAARVFSEGDPMVVKIEIRFKSRLKHLRIIDTAISPVTVEPPFGDASLLRPERRMSSVEPKRIVSLDPEGETAEVYTVAVDLGRVHLKPGLGTLFRAAWGGKTTETIHLTVPVHLQVPAGHFVFRDSFLERYNAPTIEAARLTGRVYAIDSLPRLLSSEVTNVKVDIPVTFQVRYPWRALWLTLLLVAAVLGGVGLLIWALARGAGKLQRSRRWTVEARTEWDSPLKTITEEDGRVSTDGEVVGIIRKNRFEPAAGMELMDSDGAIDSEAPIRMSLGGRTIKLFFSEQGAPAETQGQGPPPVNEF